MKGRFSTIDIAVVVQELKKFLGMRVVNVYDVDNKTYLIKIGKPDEKTFILLESGIKLHSTEFDWPKSPAPSNFATKLRKHVKNRRFESIRQLGIDRIVDLQFGSDEAAYHIIVELYDRGNIVLTDFEYSILNILRPRTDNSQDVRFAVKEIYPVDSFKTHEPPKEERLKELLEGGKAGDVLKKILVPNLDYGPAVIEHSLLTAGFPENVKLGTHFNIDTDMPKLMAAIKEAESLLNHFLTEPCKGYILQKKDKKSNLQDGGVPEEIVLYEEFHPYLFKQHEKKTFEEFESFDKSVDQFYSQIESQKLDLKVIQHEKQAMKKLDNVKKDHEKRLTGLQKEQELDILKGQLIEMNLELVDQAILIVRSALANQIDWTEIWALVKEAQMNSDPVAMAIKGLKLETNMISVLLGDPFPSYDEEDSGIRPMKVDLDLAISAYGNSRKYFDRKRQAAKKEQKTSEASHKAFKSAEKKTKQSLKEVQTAVSINKTRKTYWFEKFLWFITSENYLVIGGRDQQQNEMIVKRYMRAGDLYVHADLHGASSCIIKNPGGGPVPPKSLNEAGTMAICNSAAWDSKVVTSAWWVHQDQVSKTAPTGEYLTTGSFMIRGKKNYLPPSYLVYGFGFVFKLEEGSVERHIGERKVRTIDDDEMSMIESTTDSVADIALDISEGEDSSDDEEENKEEEKNPDGLTTISEQEGTNSSIEKDNETEINTTEEKDGSCNDEKSLSQSKEATSSEDVNLEGKDTSSCASTSTSDNKDQKPESGFEFPDTNIKLQHVKGDKYELMREVSHDSTDGDAFEPIYLGGSEPIVFGEKGQAKSRLSAKQRREMKKGKKFGVQPPLSQAEDEEEDKVSWLCPKEEIKQEETIGEAKNEVESGEIEEKSNDSKPKSKNKKAEKVPVPQAPPPKRGHKAKRKKIKEKYADQDEEERALKIELLASSGAHKIKERKEKEEEQARKAANAAHKKGKGQGKKPVNPQTQTTASGGEPHHFHEVSETNDKKNPEGASSSAKGGGESDGEEKEETPVTDDSAVLNSLTGVPVTEDELMYAIPVCAPYNALLNYKFKVKLMPGSSKKGKAVKTAVNMFLHDKTISSREKDLLKIQKDVDLSRNVPGKVKVAAPNLHKNKR